MHRWRARGHRLARRTRGTAECTAIRSLPLPRKEVRKPPTLSEPRGGTFSSRIQDVPSLWFGVQHAERWARGVLDDAVYDVHVLPQQIRARRSGRASARPECSRRAATQRGSGRHSQPRCQRTAVQDEQDRFHASSGAYDTCSSKTNSSPSSSSHWVPVWRKPSLRASAREARFVGAMLATK